MQSAAAVAGSTLDSGASVCSNLCTQKWMLILRRWPDRVFAWRYTHLLLFAAIPAVGVGLRVAAEALEGRVFFAAVSGGTATFDAESESDVTALVVVIALIACSAIIEVIGHEIVGYPHTLRVINTRLAAHTTAQD